jgi:hypothetical protein
MLDLWFFVVIKILEDGTLVSKHVGFGTYDKLCCMVCFIVFYLVQKLFRTATVTKGTDSIQNSSHGN